MIGAGGRESSEKIVDQVENSLKMAKNGKTAF